MKARRAFTLVELLVVMSIIALLISIISPSLMTAKQIARISSCSSNIAGTMRNVVMYTNSNSGMLPAYRFDYDPTTGKPSGKDSNGKLFAPPDPSSTTIAFGTGGKPNEYTETGLLNDPRNLGLVYKENYVNDYHILYCPTQPNTQNTAEYYPRPWGSGANNVMVGYMYNPNVDANASPVQYTFSPKVELFPVDRPVVCDLVYGGNFVSHVVGSEMRWNVGHINGNVATVGYRAAQAFMSDPNNKDFSGNWSTLNSQAYGLILMK